jgi:hypothetical protein
MRKSLILITVLLCLISLARAQDSSGLIAQELDKPFELDVQQKTPLPQVLKAITDKTGVPITVSQSAWELLPWGEQTTLQVKISGQTLRGALDAITRKLGLRFDLGRQAVEIKPLPALQRVGRRATVEELSVLDLLARTPLDPIGDRPTVKQVLNAVDSKLVAAKSSFAVESRITDPVAAATIPIARNATLLDAMEAIPQNTDSTWYPWGNTLVVQPKSDQIRAQLQKTITRRYSQTDIAQVLSELQSAAGVNFLIEPGAIQRIPGDSRNVDLTFQDVPIHQALESIAGYTGLAWTVNDYGVYIWNPSPNASGAHEPSVGLLTLDNGMQIVVRESQVPPDLREYIHHKTEQQFDKIRQMMKEEGFKPSTQPTTAPAEKPHDL